ncbi:hypothetical protein K438DRAFT_1962223 [Mycena galopus ATCC 62051]|nr:hypothetical protein K438DRAFT_1962223 [Mycena galopus ATCC 62051]
MSATELRARPDELNVTVEADHALVECKKPKRIINAELDTLLYTVLILPPEIVALIFLYCIPFPCQWEKPDANWRCPAPLVFLHVCRTWREIALADASLWTTPHLRFDEYYLSKSATHQRTPAQIESFFASWVERARGRPLMLTIHGDMMRCMGNVRAAALLTRFAPHVKKLDLWLSGRFKWTNRDRTLPNLVRWPLLEDIEIMAADNFHDIADAFSLAPKLRVLADNDGVLSPSSGNVTIPWKQITFFHCTLAHLQDCVDILQQAETLEDGRFYLDDGDDDGLDDETNTLVHFHLRKLFLDGLNNGLVVILPLLVLPALESLQVEELPTHPDSMLHFLERHASHLQELHIHQLLLKSLPQMPALTKLILTTKEEVYTSDLFVLLQCPERRFLPLLEHIHLYRFRSQERGDYETMARALADRWHRSNGRADIAQLRSLMLEIKLVEDELVKDFEELLSPVTALEATGVNIVVKIWGSKW